MSLPTFASMYDDRPADPSLRPRSVEKPIVCDGCGATFKLVPLGGICHRCHGTRWRVAEDVP